MMEKMSLRTKVLPSVMAIGLACGMAFSGSAHAIKVAANGIGQVLIAPFYLIKYASGDIGASRNLITVINTSDTHAVKVKAVFRSRKYCRELLDFILILSPADVWRGEIYLDESDGRVKIRSTDDSTRNLPLSDSFANVAGKNVNVPVFPVRDDSELMGHMEFFGHYSVSGTFQFKDRDGQKVNILIERGMEKGPLARLFETRVATGITGVVPNCDGVGLEDYGIANTLCPVRVNDPANLRIRGNVEVIVPGGSRMAYQMTALTGTTTNPIIENPFLEMHVKTETLIGVAWGYSRNNIGGMRQGDKILEIEQALATHVATGSYENGFVYEGNVNNNPNMQRFTGIQVTFPTKYRHIADVCNTGLLNVDRTKGQFYPPFTRNGDVTFQSLSYNNEEDLFQVEAPHSSVSGGGAAESSPEFVITDCSNMLFGSSNVPLFTFDSGMYRMRFGQTGCTQYTGIPAIVQTFKYTVDDAGTPNDASDDIIQDQMLIPASSDNWVQ